MASLQLTTSAAKDAAARIAAHDAVLCAGIDAYDAWIAARDATFARPDGATDWPAVRDAIVAKNQTEWRTRVAALTLDPDAIAEDYYGKIVDISKYVTYGDEDAQQTDEIVVEGHEEKRSEPFDYEKALASWTERCREASEKVYDKKLHERFGMDGYMRGDERDDDEC